MTREAAARYGDELGNEDGILTKLITPIVRSRIFIGTLMTDRGLSVQSDCMSRSLGPSCLSCSSDK